MRKGSNWRNGSGTTWLEKQDEHLPSWTGFVDKNGTESSSEKEQKICHFINMVHACSIFFSGFLFTLMQCNHRSIDHKTYKHATKTIYQTITKCYYDSSLLYIAVKRTYCNVTRIFAGIFVNFWRENVAAVLASSLRPNLSMRSNDFVQQKIWSNDNIALNV